MRWLVVAIAVLLGGPAVAKVTQLPPMNRTCPGGGSWDAVTSCLAKLGTVSTVATTAGARIASLAATTRYYDGHYLYVERGGRWQFAGLVAASSTARDLLGFEAVTLEGHTGYRIELGDEFPVTVQPTGAGTVSALVRRRHVVFCRGNGWHCTDAIVQCEVLVRGQAFWTFRGTLAIDGDIVRVTGDRSRAGPLCRSAEESALYWTDA
jgi:hypothetical protein